MTKRIGHLEELPLGSENRDIPKKETGYRDLDQFIADTERGVDGVTLLDLGRSPAYVAEVPMEQLEEAINVLRSRGMLAYPSGDNTIAGYINTPEDLQFLIDQTEFVVLGLPGPTSYSRLRVDQQRHTAHLTSFGLIAAYRAFHTQVNNPDRLKWKGKAFLMPIDPADQLRQLAEIYPDEEDTSEKKRLTDAVKKTKLMEYALDDEYFDKYKLTNAFDDVPLQEFQPLAGEHVQLNKPVVYKIDIDEFSKTYRSSFSVDTNVLHRNEYNPEIYLEIVVQYFNALEEYLLEKASEGLTRLDGTAIPLEIYFSQRLGDAIYVYASPQDDEDEYSDDDRINVADYLEQAIESFAASSTGERLSFKYIPMTPNNDTVDATAADHRLLRSDDTYPAEVITQREDQFKSSKQETFFTTAQYTSFLIQAYGRLTAEEKESMDPALITGTTPGDRREREKREKAYLEFIVKVKLDFRASLAIPKSTPRD